MSVHLALNKHINKWIDAQHRYEQLDSKREEKIEEVLTAAKEGKELSLVEVNQITDAINEICKSFNFPPRKRITKEMVFEYLNRD